MMLLSRFKSAVILVFVVAITMATQSYPISKSEIHPLPTTIGKPITVVPMDRGDIECSIHEWNPTSPKPYLKLLCPPQSEFALLRVYLQLTWSSAQVPSELKDDRLPSTGLTKIRTNRNAVLVLLVLKDEAGRTQKRWVAFDRVVDFALIKDRR